MKKLVSLSFIFLFLLQGFMFREYASYYGLDFNLTREKLGINLLDSTWKG